MTIPTPIALRNYRDAIREWFKHKGLEGGGGNYIRSEHKYSHRPEPTLAQFGIEGFAVKIAEKIKADELQAYRRLNPEKQSA
jgi:hypothetical protein